MSVWKTGAATGLMILRAGFLAVLAVGTASATDAQVPSAPTAAIAQTTLVLGRVSDDPKRHYSNLKPLLDYVVPRMRDVGIVSGRVLMARDAQQMTSYLRRGKVDWATETAGSALLFEERAGARPVLRTVRDGVSEYASVFFARTDTGIRTLADLRGRSVAFQSPASTSAYFAPAAALIEGGLPLIILSSPREPPPADMVGFLFARSEHNVAAWVQKRIVDAGAFSDVDWDRLQASASVEKPLDLYVVHRTQRYPRALELVRPGLDPRIEQKLIEVLLGAADDPDAAGALQAYFRSDRFLPLDADGRAQLERLRSGVQRLRSEVE